MAEGGIALAHTTTILRWVEVLPKIWLSRTLRGTLGRNVLGSSRVKQYIAGAPRAGPRKVRESQILGSIILACSRRGHSADLTRAFLAKRGGRKCSAKAVSCLRKCLSANNSIF
jgi:hypothetical protein